MTALLQSGIVIERQLVDGISFIVPAVVITSSIDSSVVVSNFSTWLKTRM
jgi:hypothetical protein